MTTELRTRPALSEGLREALRTVTFAPDLRSGKVGGHEFEGDVPKSLRRSLAHTLYTAFHTGQPSRKGKRHPAMTDPRLAEDLRSAVPHSTSAMTAHGVVGSDSPDEAEVLLGGVRVRVPWDLVTMSGPETAEVRVPAVMPKRSPGFLLVHGSGGHSLQDQEILRLYLSVPSHTDAPRIWGHLLTLLEESGIGYQAKVLSARSSYPRRDAIVVYLGQSSWPAVPGLVEGMAGTEGLGDEGSLYTARLAPGIGWAWEPDGSQVDKHDLSFGQHRSRIIAEALIRAQESGSDREEEVARALADGGVPPESPHRSYRSPAIGL
ncbi:T3SS effector HopA1 family protein [Nocardiopsis valliformis]|uniref:T3SS effector HopA1 family protein n=1 Tax=Nocardiopsis valliformis TaxID=239974 RepID=UPI0003449F45|nr:T3SS effector HopA1 family protein [Nocardiopsis valliformis]